MIAPSTTHENAAMPWLERQALVCPLDATPFKTTASSSLVCSHGHTFDRAREGYYNLLAVQHKASRDPGDTAAMVAARRRILDAGLYAPVANAVARVVHEQADATPADRLFTLLDAGCGEGTYLRALNTAKPLRAPYASAGIDISKWAVRAAAKRDPTCLWAVASNKQLPFAAGSIDFIMSLFGFPVWTTFAALQPVGGHVLLVNPGPDHLIELRSIIYPSLKQPAPRAQRDQPSYRSVMTDRVCFPIHLASREQIADLLTMTPHDHRATQAGRDALSAYDTLTLTADVKIALLVRI